MKQFQKIPHTDLANSKEVLWSHHDDLQETPVKKVQELMTRTVYSMKDHQTLNDAAQLMWVQDCGRCLSKA